MKIMVSRKGKAVIRQALSRFNGELIQSYGDKAGLWRVPPGASKEIWVFEDYGRAPSINEIGDTSGDRPEG